jgi:hypothetical protein
MEIIDMTTHQAPTGCDVGYSERIKCEVIGRPRLIATLDSDGIHVWCIYCRTSHLIEKARCIAAWEKGESVQCTGKEEIPASGQHLVE